MAFLNNIFRRKGSNSRSSASPTPSKSSTSLSPTPSPTPWPIYATIKGPIVVIGFGSIARGLLPLISRHFNYTRSHLTIVDPSPAFKNLASQYGAQFLQTSITRNNYVEVLTSLLTVPGQGQGFCLNLAVDTSAKDIMELCRELGALYLDTVAEPWPGVYYDKNRPMSERTNYALRQVIIDAREKNPGGPTAVSCCGANPGCVSWMAKQALLNIASDIGLSHSEPTTRSEWAALMRDVGIRGIHVAERDTQHSSSPKPIGTFVNTWSIDGFLSEATQPAELGWGTHEKWKPSNAREQEQGSKCAIYLMQSGAETKVRSWTPIGGPQFGFLVTHNEAITMSDYFTVRGDDAESVVYRPTVHYAYHPCDDTVLSIHEMFGQAGKWQEKKHILTEGEIIGGVDELGVLLYGHSKNAYWYGSRLSIETARLIAPYQNATGLQVTSAILAGMVWALENPNAGIVEVEEMDFKRCLEVQKPYLGDLGGVYTDWTPLDGRMEKGESDGMGLFPEDVDESDAWQFRNVLVH